MHRPCQPGPSRSGRSRAAAGLVCLLLLGIAAGCSGSGETRKSNTANQVELPDDPAAALTELDRRLAEDPNDVRSLVARAEILSATEDHVEAASAWNAVLAAGPDKKLRRHATIQVARSWEHACGELRVLEEEESTEREHAGRALSAWDDVRDDVREHEGTLGVVRSLYLLGRIDAAMDEIVKVESGSAPLSQERCLALLIQEQREANPMAVVRALDRFARSPDEAVRNMAVVQLVRLGETAHHPEVSHTAEGYLVRLTREDGPGCAALTDWEASRNEGKANRLAAAHRARAKRMAREALDRGRPIEAWRNIEKLLRGEDSPAADVTALLNTCCDQLCSICAHKLEVGDVDTAGELAAVLRVLPKSWLGTAQSDCVSSTLRAHQVATIRAQAENTLADATSAVDQRKPDEALAILDPLLEQFPPELVPEVQMIRARALAQQGEKRTALRLLEKHGPYADPAVQRLQGVLLAEANRGEEAEAILESLPLKFFNVEAFDGLLLALEQQSKWEKLIARLNTLGGQMPVRYLPARRRAVMGAAERRMSNLDPDGAIAVLRGNLTETELQKSGAGTLLVKALLEANRTDEALAMLIGEGGGIESVPAELVEMVAERAASSLEPEERFALLSRIPEWDRDASTQEFLAGNWPRYGSYLPAQGNWTATYRRRTYGEDGQVVNETLETMQIEWKRSYFAVTRSDRSKETWRASGDLWIRNTLEREWWVPMRAESSPPLDEVTSPDGVVAQVVEAGHSVTTPKQTFDGCIGVRITTPGSGVQESTRIDMAPEIGDVMIVRTIGDEVVERLELIGMVKSSGGE